MTRRLGGWAATCAKWVAALVAAVNTGRLNTPDTTAGPVEWALYVGLPAVLAAATGAGVWLVSPGLETDPVDKVRQQLLDALVELVRLRRHDAALRIAEQLRLFDDSPPPQRGGGY